MRTPFLHIATLIAFLVNSFGLIPLSQAQDFILPVPGVMVHLSPPFNPPMLKGIKVNPDNPFRFEFILDKGDDQQKQKGTVPFSSRGQSPSASKLEQLKEESTKLIKYFLASLTIPEKDLWVNLSPYEKDRIIPNSFGHTEMGRDLLAEDYMLKQITASLVYPEDETGKKFWKRIYEQAAKRFGTTNIPVNTFNKVWIVPEKAVVYENSKTGTAYVVESRLKVMLEQDYLSLEKHRDIESNHSLPLAGRVGGDVSALGSQVVREIIIPELTREVNEDKNFAQLRQVYNSLILATWYKMKIKNSILAQVYLDKNKIAGVTIDDPQEKERIYQRYLQAFKKGAYNYVKEDLDPITQTMVPKKYFSGGFAATNLRDFAMTTTKVFSDPAMLDEAGKREVVIEAGVEGVTARDDQAMRVKELGELAKRGSVDALKELIDLEMSRDELSNSAQWEIYEIINQKNLPIFSLLENPDDKYLKSILVAIVNKMRYTSPRIFNRGFLYSIWRIILNRFETYKFIQNYSYEARLIGAIEAATSEPAVQNSPFNDLKSFLSSPLPAVRQKAFDLLAEVPFSDPLEDNESSVELREKWMVALHGYLNETVENGAFDVLEKKIQSDNLEIQKQAIGRWFEASRQYMYQRGETVPLKNWKILDIVAKQVAHELGMKDGDFKDIVLTFFGGGITPDEMDAVVFASSAKKERAKVFAEAVRERAEELGFEIDIAAIGNKNTEIEKQELVITPEEFKALMSEEKKNEVRRSALLKGRIILGDAEFYDHLTKEYTNDLGDNNGESLYEVLSQGDATASMSDKPEIRLVQIISWLGLVYANARHHHISDPTDIPAILAEMKLEGLLSQDEFVKLEDILQKGIRTRALLGWKDYEKIMDVFEKEIWGDKDTRHGLYWQLLEIKKKVLDRLQTNSAPDEAMRVIENFNKQEVNAAQSYAMKAKIGEVIVKDQAMLSVKKWRSLTTNSVSYSKNNGNLAVEIRLAKDAFKYGLADSQVEQILRVASHENLEELQKAGKIKYSGRSIIIALPKKDYLHRAGKVFKAIRIKGITYLQGKPVMATYMGEGSNIAQPNIELIVDKKGRVDFKPAFSHPQGSLYLDETINEFSFMRQAFDAGVRTGYPIGTGIFLDEKMSFHKIPVGFVIIAEEGVDDNRVGEEAVESFKKAGNYEKRIEAHEEFEVDTMLDALLLRQLHGTGIIHGHPHPHNFIRLEDGETAMADFTTAMSIKGMSRDQFITRMFQDFYAFWHTTMLTAFGPNMNLKMDEEEYKRRFLMKTESAMKKINVDYVKSIERYFSEEDLRLIGNGDEQRGEIRLRKALDFVNTSLLFDFYAQIRFGNSLNDVYDFTHDDLIRIFQEIGGNIYDHAQLSGQDQAMKSGPLDDEQIGVRIREGVLEELQSDQFLTKYISNEIVEIEPEHIVNSDGNFSSILLDSNHPGIFYKIAQSKSDKTNIKSINELTIREAKALIRLQNMVSKGTIPEVLAIGVNHDGAVWVKLKGIINGQNLNSDLWKSFNLVDKTEVLIRAAQIFKQINDAGWVHNDIFPSNILVNENGDVMIVDFGFTASEGERVDVDGVDVQHVDDVRRKDSDIYAFGKTLYILFLGKQATVLGALRGYIFQSGLPDLIHGMIEENRQLRKPSDMEGVIVRLQQVKAKFPEEIRKAAKLKDNAQLVLGKDRAMNSVDVLRRQLGSIRILGVRGGFYRINFVDQKGKDIEFSISNRLYSILNVTFNIAKGYYFSLSNLEGAFGNVSQFTIGDAMLGFLEKLYELMPEGAMMQATSIVHPETLVYVANKIMESKKVMDANDELASNAIKVIKKYAIDFKNDDYTEDDIEARWVLIRYIGQYYSFMKGKNPQALDKIFDGTVFGKLFKRAGFSERHIRINEKDGSLFYELQKTSPTIVNAQNQAMLSFKRVKKRYERDIGEIYDVYNRLERDNGNRIKVSKQKTVERMQFTYPIVRKFRKGLVFGIAAAITGFSFTGVSHELTSQYLNFDSMGEWLLSVSLLYWSYREAKGFVFVLKKKKRRGFYNSRTNKTTIHLNQGGRGVVINNIIHEMAHSLKMPKNRLVLSCLGRKSWA